MNEIRGHIYVVISGLVLILLFGSCASTTVIRSNPEGAKVYLNGEPVGKTPYTHTDTKIVGSKNTVRLEKEGYETLHAFFSRNEEANVGAIIGALFVLIPVLWVMDYKPSHTYELQPASVKGVDGTEETQANGALSASQISRLKELKELLDEGIITREEFDDQKKKLIGENP